MVELRDMFIYDLEGDLYRESDKLMSFKIVNRELIRHELYGWEAKVSKGRGIGHFKAWGVSYWSINEFFKERTVLDGSMFIHEYLNGLGLKHYDFEKIVKAICGWNPRDRIWLKYNGGMFQTYNDIVKAAGLIPWT